VPLDKPADAPVDLFVKPQTGRARRKLWWWRNGSASRLRRSSASKDEAECKSNLSSLEAASGPVSVGAFLLGTELAFSQKPLGAGAIRLPDMGFSLLRVFGSLILVLALFLAGIWLFKNWQRLALAKGRTPKLSVLEVKSLGGRHALYLVAYEQQRLLISSSPTGINLLAHLPEADTAEVLQPLPTFTESLQRVLSSKS